MSSALKRSTRERTGADRGEEANADECALFDMMGVPGFCEVLSEQLDYALLSRFRVSRAMRRWIDPLQAGRGVEGREIRLRSAIDSSRRLLGPRALTYSVQALC